MRILVIQLKRIGDVILTTPLLAALRENLPEAEITLALDASTAALAPALDADRTLVFRRGLAGLGFWRELARGGFDICLDVTGNDRSATATSLPQDRRARYSRDRCSRRRWCRWCCTLPRATPSSTRCRGLRSSCRSRARR